MSCARESEVARNFPDFSTGFEGTLWAFFFVDGNALMFDFLELMEEVEVDAIWVIDVAIGVGTGDDFYAEVLKLLNGVDSDVTGTGDDGSLDRKSVV